MATKTPTRLAALFTLASPLLAVQAQTTQGTATATSTPPPPPLSPFEQTVRDIKNPIPWMNWGADLRVRDEYFDNILTLNPNNPLHLQNYIRIRGRIWASITPVEDVSFNVRLADEVREWLRPAGYTAFKGQSGLDWREGIFDTLNVQWRNVLQQPLTVTVGRQDYLPGTPSALGDGWLVGDGTPLDGSWTYYLDSARLAYELKDQHTTIQAIGILQNAQDDSWLGAINDQDLYTSEQNEKGAILWVSNQSLTAANLDGYFIYKHDNQVGSFSPSNPAPVGDNADIYTLGGRVTGLVAEHWKYSVEGAYQFGEKQDRTIKNALLAPDARTTGFRDIDAFGVNAKFSYLFKDKLNNQVGLAYEFLSGDNPNTKNDEMFDNLWGRYPRWGEIGAYSFAAETRFGQEANLHRIGPGWSCNPMKNMDLSAAYYVLLAQEEIATRGAAGLFAGNVNATDPALSRDHGTFRGHFFQAILKYKFNSHMMAHLWTEAQLPGDYYVHRATWYFIRPEIQFIF